MAKGSKLQAALDRHKGVDHKLERQKRLQKEAGKRKRQKAAQAQEQEPEVETDDEEEDDDITADLEVEEFDSDDGAANLQLQEEEIAAKIAELNQHADGQADGDMSDEADEDIEDEEEDESAAGIINGAGLAMEDESDSDSDDEEMSKPAHGPNIPTAQEDDEEDDEEDIPLSDIESLASEDRADIVPHQRLTINNTAALLRSLKSFALPSSLPFAANQSLCSKEAVAIDDVENDLTRESAFYRQSLEAVAEARARLKNEGVPFSRPTDYFAEMVKSEEQMGKVRSKMLDEAARKKASADAKRQRDLKKFGKAVQVAKLQERQKEKRETMDRISTLKRKRQGADLTTNEDEMFDVALEDAAETAKNDRTARRAKGAENGPNRKRQKKDAKFGFGGKKRFAKSNDAKSAGDMSGYSAKRMKSGKPGKSRPGKSKRAKMS